MREIKFYTPEETKKIKKMFADAISREEIEAYAKSIGRTFNEIKQKNYYEVTQKKRKNTIIWSEGQLNFLLNNWRSFDREKREKYAKSIGRTYSACEKMFYKARPKAKEQKPGEITVTHIESTSPERLSAIIKVGDITLELPNTTKRVEINGNVLMW